MRTLDFSPLYRTAVGFDHLVNLVDRVKQTERSQPAYPPYNIELVADDQYRVSLALAGFELSELDIVLDQGVLTVSGEKTPKESGSQYLHQGIANRNFERSFQLAEHVEVKGASFENGLLDITLKKELPEAMKPINVEIKSSVGVSGGQFKAA